MKRRITTYFLCFLYLLAMFRPVAPFFEYYFNYDYISKVLCINKDEPELDCKGKCYLKKQLKEQESSQEKNSTNHLSIDLDKYPVTTLGMFSYSLSSFFNLKETCFPKELGKTKKYLSKVFHPPTPLLHIG